MFLFVLNLFFFFFFPTEKAERTQRMNNALEFKTNLRQREEKKPTMIKPILSRNP